jgi:hypothetical protein
MLAREILNSCVDQNRAPEVFGRDIEQRSGNLEP